MIQGGKSSLSRDPGGIATPIPDPGCIATPTSMWKITKMGGQKYSNVNYRWSFRIQIHARCAQSFMHEFYWANESDFSLRLFWCKFLHACAQLFLTDILHIFWSNLKCWILTSFWTKIRCTDPSHPDSGRMWLWMCQFHGGTLISSSLQLR